VGKDSFCEHGAVHISARVDYAVRALVALAVAPAEAGLKGETIAAEQGLPKKFVENILGDLRRAGFVTSQRGNVGGYRLARPAGEIPLADVFRSLEGPLAEVRGVRPEQAAYEGAAEHLLDAWVAVRAGLRLVLESITIADVASGRFPAHIRKLIADPEAWIAR
jgi:Rrf2 family protein